MKIFQKVLGGYFLEHPVHAHCDYVRSYSIPHVYSTHTRLHDLWVHSIGRLGAWCINKYFVGHWYAWLILAIAKFLAYISQGYVFVLVCLSVCLSVSITEKL